MTTYIDLIVFVLIIFFDLFDLCSLVTCILMGLDYFLSNKKNYLIFHSFYT